jgi:CubicO group peptidase (beta-lactamase class C family)
MANLHNPDISSPGDTPGPPGAFSEVIETLERQRADGLHDGAQAYVSRFGEPLLDVAVGESDPVGAPGRALERDDVMLWYSSGKPVTTTAVLQLWERGRLELDDPVAEYVEGWGAGKERVTLRHVLTHTGGFTMAGRGELFDTDVPYAEAVARIAAHPAEWEPGTKAGYHPTSGWKILGAVVEAVDGRPIDRYLADEVFGPAGMKESRLGIPPGEQAALGQRLVPVAWKGHALAVQVDGGLQMVPYHIERIHNQSWHVAKVEPGGGMRGPARELGRFYESLLGFAPPVLEPRTVEVMAAVHRYGLPDVIFGGMKTPWGLGVQVAGGMSGGPGRRAFGHGGMASSRGLADPDAGLVAVLVANGLPDPIKNEQRMFAFTDAVYRAFGDELAPLRLAARPMSDAFRPST